MSSEKLPTMVPTPTLTESASSSAISASEKPDNCWRLSAHAHSAIGARAIRSPTPRIQPSTTGNSSAAPSSNPASTAKPSIRLVPNQNSNAADSEGDAGQGALPDQPALLRLLPGKRLRRDQQRQPQAP